MSDRGEIVFLGEFRFPEGDAAAVRTLSLARICRDLGFGVTVIGKGRLRAADYDTVRGGHYIEGIRYATMNPQPVSAADRLRHPLKRMKLFASALESACTEKTRAVVINASSSAWHVPFVKAFCRRRAIRLIADVCEWYDPRQMKYGRLDPTYYIFQLVFHYVLPRLSNVIVVSRLLERRFEGNARNVIRIPAPLDVTTFACSDDTPKDRLVLLYTGIPGRKDLLKEVVVALASLTHGERSQLEFRLLGLSRDELVHLMGDRRDLVVLLRDTVQPLGRVPREEVLPAMREAHFTVLVRPWKRYANAGFPSKIAESLAAGVPVITNFTSDLGEYLKDGVDSLRLPGYSPADIAGTIRRALALSSEELSTLRRGARATAEQQFDYRLFAGPLHNFLEQLR